MDSNASPMTTKVGLQLFRGNEEDAELAYGSIVTAGLGSLKAAGAGGDQGCGHTC